MRTYSLDLYYASKGKSLPYVAHPAACTPCARLCIKPCRPYLVPQVTRKHYFMFGRELEDGVEQEKPKYASSKKLPNLASK